MPFFEQDLTWRSKISFLPNCFKQIMHYFNILFRFQQQGMQRAFIFLDKTFPYKRVLQCHLNLWKSGTCSDILSNQTHIYTRTNITQKDRHINKQRRNHRFGTQEGTKSNVLEKLKYCNGVQQMIWVLHDI